VPSASEVVEHEGYLFKIGARLRGFRKRWYFLSHKFLYWFHASTDTTPAGVVMLEGAYVKPVDDAHAPRYFGLSLLPASASGDAAPRLLYARTEVERNEWVSMLRRACRTVAFDESYRMGRRLGQGRFSVVYEATRCDSGGKVAVKVINKATLTATERELLRSEIAALRLVRHPHIIRLEDVHETGSTLYIVLELLTGGELFENIVGRARFTEDEVRELARPLLDAVAYLHGLGIVHRDLKPENILCGASLNDVKIADFGLSKLVHPTEVLSLPCGTLSYVAPEVLAMQGYSKPADVWSIGVVLYLVARGRLPFEGEQKDLIIRRTLRDPVDFSHKCWVAWSPEGRDFVARLLDKDARTRLTARGALQHAWMRASAAAAPAPGEVAAAASAGGAAPVLSAATLAPATLPLPPAPLPSAGAGAGAAGRA
jgi:hypothetical protein